MSAWYWILEHPQTITAVTSAATLVVWVLYLQLFYLGYRRQKQAKLLITRGGGHSTEARCMITNMSPEIVFVSVIVVELRSGKLTFTRSLSDTERDQHEGRDERSDLLQGPLGSGEYLDIGSFADLISSDLGDERLPHTPPDSIRIIAAGTYTWHDRLVAAERSFRIKAKDGRQDLEPEQQAAKQIYSRKDRKRISALLAKLAAGQPIFDDTGP